MTLVAALSDFQGALLFADTQEIVSGISKKSVRKLRTYDLPNRPFRFAIAGATNDASYVDMLQEEIATTLLSLDACDLLILKERLTETLTDFYSKHVWQRTSDKPQMEYLIVVQPLPTGAPQIVHISESAVNISEPNLYDVTIERKSIGIGSYLANYLFTSILGGGNLLHEGDSLAQLAAAAVYVSREVRENIDGCGPVEEIVLFDKNGGYDDLDSADIQRIEKNLETFHTVMSDAFAVATDVAADDDTFRTARKFIDTALGEIHREQLRSHIEWQNNAETRTMIRQMFGKKQAS